ncbi:cold-shock DNA-binding protein family [Variovorax sp. HW608]|uniref:cold shock domain-containing protein n=1 Tax=Variovorax sp. HW608 TaxID=1034889 RepID=UPI00081FD74C|nr:cold shock domain-containing protein [Variovorax sp. HW608]SCK09032.1 cold-shock DNA-binding protein family [Variovorax sp. HW608]
MTLVGKLISWNDERGFGFIAPRDGGRELFVHISAFPRDDSRPTVGETLTYELGRGKDGKPQAVNVYRQALGKPSTYPRAQMRTNHARRSPVQALISVVLVFAIGAFGYVQYQRHVARIQPASASVIQNAAVTESAQSNFRCDGRTYCSQMTSCAEAKFFLKNCPGTRMDGNHDGVPCEQQWCTSPLAK